MGEPISIVTPFMPRSTELLDKVIVPVDVVVFCMVKAPPSACTIVPEPIVSVEPDVINDNAPLAVILLLVVKPPLALSVKLTVAPVEIPLPVKAVLSIRVTLPVVLNVTLGVAILSEPMAPLPPVKAREVEPVRVPAV